MAYDRPTRALKHYKAGNTTVAAGATVEIALSPIKTAFDVIIINDDVATNVLQVQLNNTTNDVITIAAGEGWAISNFQVSRVFITNPGAIPVAYRYYING